MRLRGPKEYSIVVVRAADESGQRGPDAACVLVASAERCEIRSGRCRPRATRRLPRRMLGEGGILAWTECPQF
jgi:hypothetical protein